MSPPPCSCVTSVGFQQAKPTKRHTISEDNLAQPPLRGPQILHIKFYNDFSPSRPADTGALCCCHSVLSIVNLRYVMYAKLAIAVSYTQQFSSLVNAKVISCSSLYTKKLACDLIKFNNS
jgi:hypothetical protein